MSLTQGHDKAVRFASPANDGQMYSLHNASEQRVDLLVSLEESLKVVRCGLPETKVLSERHALEEVISDGIPALSKSECAVLILASLSKYLSNQSEFDVGDLLIASETYMKKPLGVSIVYQNIEALEKYGAFVMTGKKADDRSGRKTRTFQVTPVGRALAMLVVLSARGLRHSQSTRGMAGFNSGR